jgi:hypothetical protein
MKIINAPTSLIGREVEVTSHRDGDIVISVSMLEIIILQIVAISGINIITTQLLFIYDILLLIIHVWIVI